MREARFAVRRPFLRMAAATAVATSGLLAASLAFADEPPAVNVVTIVDHQALDAFRDGAAEALKEAGYESGKTLDWTFQSAQGNTGTVAQIARKFVGSQPEAILAISTPAAQAVVAATKQIPVVYGAVTDPVAAQLVKTMGPSGTNVTGVSDRLEPGRQVELIRKIVPSVKTVGMIYNPAEANSKVAVNEMKAALSKAGIELVEAGDTRVLIADRQTVTAMADRIEAARDRGDLRYQDLLKGPIRLEDVFAEAVSQANQEVAR